MGKKRTRSTYVSKGERRNVSKSTCKLAAKDTTVLEKARYKHEAWKRGKNPWLVVPGFTPKESMRRIRANDLWGSPNRNSTNTKEKESEWA